MAPKPQEQSALQAPVAGAAAGGERVVISGMAGLYPKARYVTDLQRILYDKENPITSDSLRWQFSHPEVAQYTGNVPELDRFDAQFFKVHYKLGTNMDSMSRKILEQTYEAIYDAGVSPEHLSGKKVGVYVGSCFSETEKACFYAAANRNGFGIAGCSKSMFANRISYWLNAKGPSVSIDQACCSSISALEAAHKAITQGECEAAVVGGAYLCLHPQSSVHMGRIMNISMDGKTKSFAEDASGCAKSEAINVLFLQKAKDAKRVYADVVYVKSEYISMLQGETGPRYGFYRNTEHTVKFLKNFYKEAGVPPTVVEYVEAFGSAVPEADKSELDTIDQVFCERREDPLLVGSVMSNIGYGEAASGISAVTKVLLGYHTGRLAANLHCAAPRQDVAALQDGRMRVLTEHAPFRRTYAAVNSMSVTGVNAHVLLHSHYKQKNLDRYKSSIPRLVLLSGRQDSAVDRAIDILKSHPIDPEELALLHNIHETNISGHLGKGYTILATNVEGKTVSLAHRAEYCDGAQRPLWFVYSGMGSQWAGMGAQLMQIPIFAAAIQKCHKVLEPKGLDIVHIITSPDKTIFDNILHSFVGIAAVQIGLTDILRELGLVPDNIIGHSVGELGCAYADGCLTAEEMILAAYSRGRVSLETPFIRGSMAAVGMGAQQIAALCPPEIVVACHNSAESCTISGPADAMRNFVAELTARKVFAKEVPCSNIAYHSRYIAEAGPALLKYLKEVIPEPRARSSRWVSTSVPQDRWEQPIAQNSSAEYHTNNLLSPVLFEETSALIPSNAVLVEVAPHGLLQAILKRALPDSATNVPLTRRGHSDPVTMLLDAIGRLYLHGHYPKIRALYPKVEFPVSTGTPLLSHYVTWAHNEKWALPLYQSARRTKTASYTYVISVHDDEYSYLRGHVIRNKTLLPFSFALVAAWDTLSMSLDMPKKSLGVEFSNVKLFTQPILHERKVSKLSISIHKGSGMFEIMSDNFIVATGCITVTPKINALLPSNATESNEVKTGELSLQDVYKSLHEREYAYSGEFCNIYETDSDISKAKILWNNNWVTLIDAMIQLQILKYTHTDVALLDHIRKIVIDPKALLENLELRKDKENNDINVVNVSLSDVQERVRGDGITFESMKFRKLHNMEKNKMTLETLKFIPRFDSEFDIPASLYVLLQIVAENSTKNTINVIGVKGDSDAILFDEMTKIVGKGLHGVKVNYELISLDAGVNDNTQVYENVDVILVKHLSRNDKISQRLHHLLPRNTFIVNEEYLTTEAARGFPMNFYNVISVMKNQETKLELACWKPVVSAPLTSAFTVRTESDLSLLNHARRNCSSKSGLLVLASYPPAPGLVNLVKQWRREPNASRIHVIMINENSEQNHDTEEIPNVNLAFNTFENGTWGGEYFVPLSEETDLWKEPMTLESEIFGDVDSLRWVKMQPLTGAGTLVNVQYAGLNVSDMRQAFGLNTSQNQQGYGMGFSGITESGERVMGVVAGGAASSQVRAAPELTWPVPAHWTLEDAATVPLAYVFAYYCIALRSAMRLTTKNLKQFTVLVHGGAGALGQAAIRVALARGWRVFTTVRDQDKKDFLLGLFPQLNEADIGYSRDPTFGDMVLGTTSGEGCNLIICCLTGDLKDTSLKCCGDSSSLMDTTQILKNENFSYGMYHLTKERSYVAVDFKNIFDPTSQDAKKLHALLVAGISSGEVVPLTRVVLGAGEAARALRLLHASCHRGRVLLRLRDQPAPPARRSTAENCSHVVISDCDEVAVQLVEKLIDDGNRRLQLHFQESTNYLTYKIKSWEKRGIQVSAEYGRLEEINSVSSVLHKAVGLGPVQGVHVVACDSLGEGALQKVDAAARAACPDLKTFLIVTSDIHRGHSTCLQRAKAGLPATLLDVSAFESVEVGGPRYIGAAEAARRSWLSAGAHTVLRATPLPHTHTTLLQSIAAITGLQISEDANDNDNQQLLSISTTLADLGLPTEQAAVVTRFLRDTYNTYVDERNVPSLTVERLKQIEESVSDSEYKQVEGLETFFSHVDSDELLATTDLVYLPTLTNSSQMRDDEFDATQTSLCIVPGLEGLHARFHALAARLKLPAFVLQPGLDRPDEGPTEMAQRYAQRLLKTGLQSPFYLLGYETGVVVALEMAAILEEHGLSGTVFCLGGAPAATQALLERSLAAFPSSVALEEALAQHMFALMAPGASAPLAGGRQWGARVDACVHALLGRVPHSAQYARGLLDAARARLATARRALPAPRALRSRLVLLRAGDVAECSLHHYSRDLLLDALPAPLAHLAADPAVPALINKHLDQRLLKEFEQKNLCDTYLMNADAFMNLCD